MSSSTARRRSSGLPPLTPARPEAELLLLAVRRRLDGGRIVRARELARQDLDWGMLLGTARYQGVAPIVSAALEATCADLLPEGTRASLRRYTRGNARRNLALAAELLRLLGNFEAAGLRVMPFKGPVLACSLYGDLGARQVSDLDLWVHGDDVEPARRLLETLGYQPEKCQPGWEYHHVQERTGLLLDLHERLAPDYFPSPVPFQEAWNDAERVTLLGTAVRSLPAPTLFLVLSIQLAKDCREWKERLGQLCDIAELLQSHPELDWKGVLDRARRLGVERILFLAVLLCNTLLDTDVPPALLQRVRGARAVRAAAAPIQERLLRQLDGSLEFVRYREEVWHQDTRFYLRIRERSTDRLRYLWSSCATRLELWLSPSERDRRWIRLPRALRGLYYVVRPLRIAAGWVRGRRASPV